MQVNQPQTHEIRIEDYFWIVFRSKWSVLAILVIAILTALLKNDVSPPYYEATAKIWIQEGGQQALPFLENLLMPGLGRATQLQTFREIILTRTILEPALQELKEEGRYDPLPVHRGASIVWIANLLGIQLSDKTEQADLTIEEWKRETIEALLEDLLTVEPSRDADIITIKVKQRTPERAQEMANKIAAVFQEFIKEDMRGQMKETEKFTTEQRDIVKAKLESAEEQLRQFQVLNQTINLEAEAEMIIQNVGQLDLQKTQLTQRLEGAKARLQSLTDKLNTVSQNVLSAETLTDNPNVLQLEQQLHGNQIRLAELKDKYPKLDHPEIKRLQARIKETQEEIAREDRQRVTSQTTSPNPVHQALEQQTIEALAEIRQIERQLQELNLTIESYDNLIEKWPEKQLELARLKRTLLLNQEMFSTLEATKQEASIVSAAELGSVKILERANIPDCPVSPRKKLNLVLGLLVGFALGIGLAFLREYFDNTYPTLEEAQRQLEYLPEPPSFLGMVPVIEASDHRTPLVAHDAPKSGAAEAFRILRTKLQFLNPEIPLKTVLITSSTPGEGKSTIASNLAVTLAQMNKKVLLIDADMRRPVQHHVFTSATLVHAQQQLPSESSGDSVSSGALEPLEISLADQRKPGLSELLVRMNELEPREALYSVVKKTEVDNLHLISSGTIPPNPAELLNSEVMQKLMELVEQEYDYVIFDSPPVRAVADPIILSTLVDTVIFVFDIAKTRKYEILGGIESLNESAAKKIGALCNLTNPQHGGYYGYGRYGYSKYGYSGRYRYSYYYYYDSKDEADADEGKRG
ncbi:MAG: AAA family ATPase [Candidatus Poribacteria bacterium]|nr:AAA family ATPase [Candidatus Poribacteria bacterium]